MSVTQHRAGVFDGAALVQSWRLQTLRERTSDELGLLVDGLFAHSRIERVQIRGVILGSVVPPLTGTICAMVQRYFGVTALVVEPGVNTSMPILYERPSEVGADRIVNAVAAYEKFGKGLGQPLIVVDFGTATTLDAIGEREYPAAPSAPVSRFGRRCSTRSASGSDRRPNRRIARPDDAGDEFDRSGDTSGWWRLASPGGRAGRQRDLHRPAGLLT
jgi:hypothetical protein